MSSRSCNREKKPYRLRRIDWTYLTDIDIPPSARRVQFRTEGFAQATLQIESSTVGLTVEGDSRVILVRRAGGVVRRRPQDGNIDVEVGHDDNRLEAG